MKTLLNLVLYTGLLLITKSGWAGDTPLNPIPSNPLGWVSAPNASFSVRTERDRTGDLLVHVNQRSSDQLTLQLLTLRGEVVNHLPLTGPDNQLRVRLQVSELAENDYRLLVSNGSESVVILLTLNRLVTPIPQATTLPDRSATPRYEDTRSAGPVKLTTASTR